jgi:hypothetical protein
MEFVFVLFDRGYVFEGYTCIGTLKCVERMCADYLGVGFMSGRYFSPCNFCSLGYD